MNLLELNKKWMQFATYSSPDRCQVFGQVAPPALECCCGLNFELRLE